MSQLHPRQADFILKRKKVFYVACVTQKSFQPFGAVKFRKLYGNNPHKGQKIFGPGRRGACTKGAHTKDARTATKSRTALCNNEVFTAP